MLTQRWGTFSILMFTTVFLNDVHGLCEYKYTSDNQPFPDPNKIYDVINEYAMRVEVNDIQNMKSMYVNEYYDALDRTAGRVDSHFDGKQKTFLYNFKTKEAFIFGTGPDCQTETTEEVRPPYENFNVYDWKYLDRFGPSAMLLKAYEEKTELEFEGPRTVRGLNANVWKRCAEKDKLTIRYMLIDEAQGKKIFGFQNSQIPLRITVEGTLGTTKINQSYEFIHFQPDLHDTEALLSIPVNKGCKRLAEHMKKMPIPKENFLYEAEIVYTVHFQKDKHIYINNLKAVYDGRSELFAYTTIPWIAHNDSKFANAGDELFRVYDTRNGYLYEVDFDKTSCNISATTEEDSGPSLKLPNNDTFFLLNTNVINVDTETAFEFEHLGKGTVRGKKVDIFERKTGDEEFWNITTRYYLAGGQRVVSEVQEENSLLKVAFTEYMLGRNTTELVFNFYYYNELLLHKRETFDVSSCFREQNQTEWFQVIFPYDDAVFTADDLINAFPKLRYNFLTLLIFDEIATPVRVPRILLDISDKFLYITVALLERVPAKLDFEFEANVRLNSVASAVPQGLTTEEGCYQACIQSKKCRGINYCGVNCALLNQNYTSEMGSEDKKCTLSLKVKESTQLTMEQVKKKMEERIGVRDFRLEFTDRHGHLQTLQNPTFKQGIAFGLNDYKDDDTNKKIDSSFTIFRSGANIKSPDTSSKQSFAECQRECLSDSACQSLSFCEFTSMCSLSKFHGEDIDEGNLVQNDMCTTLTRRYTSSFNQFPGYSMITKAEVSFPYENPESCAKACIIEKKIQCRSFDLCSGGPAKTKCLLHSSHITDSNGQDVTASNCEHYSRNYVLDFKVEKGKALMESAVKQKIVDLPSVEECAKLCVENPDCKAFDFCRTPFKKESQCYISTTIPSPQEKKNNPTCSLYSRPDGKTENLLSPVKIETVEHTAVHNSEKLFADDDGQENVQIIVDDTGYSKSLTGGIAFFLFLVGTAIGGAAMFGYGYYKANRRV